MTHFRIWTTGLVLVALCGVSLRAQTLIPVDMPDGVIVWSPARPLTWDDFKGKSPRRLDGALSVLGYGYAIGCPNGYLQSRILSYFVPTQSYVAGRISTSGLASRVGIVHEQAHFDLKEVFARRARKKLAELKDPCKQTDDQLNAIVEVIFKEERAEQVRYDTRTGNGENLTAQEDWNRKIAADLLALKDFTDPAGR